MHGGLYRGVDAHGHGGYEHGLPRPRDAGAGGGVAPDDHLHTQLLGDISHASFIGIHGQELGNIGL